MRLGTWATLVLPVHFNEFHHVPALPAVGTVYGFRHTGSSHVFLVEINYFCTCVIPGLHCALAVTRARETLLALSGEGGEALLDGVNASLWRELPGGRRGGDSGPGRHALGALTHGESSGLDSLSDRGSLHVVTFLWFEGVVPLTQESQWNQLGVRSWRESHRDQGVTVCEWMADAGGRRDETSLEGRPSFCGQGHSREHTFTSGR